MSISEMFLILHVVLLAFQGLDGVTMDVAPLLIQEIAPAIYNLGSICATNGRSSSNGVTCRRPYKA